MECLGDSVGSLLGKVLRGKFENMRVGREARRAKGAKTRRAGEKERKVGENWP